MDATVDWKFEEVESCLLCRGTAFTPIFARSIRSVPLRFVKCTACGLVFQTPRFTPDALASYFSSSFFIKDSASSGSTLDELLGYYDYEEWDDSYKRTARPRLGRIQRFKSPPGRLLEIGTATGSFLDEARRAGFDVRGLDVSATFADMARTRYGVDVEVDFIEDTKLPDAHYDVVCSFGGVSCWRDPLRALQNIRGALKRDGIFVLNHPDVDGVLARLYGARYPEFNHASLTIFSNATMRRALEATQFEVIFSENERQYASLGRIVTYLKSPLGVKVSKALGLDRRLIPVIAFGTTFSICVPRR
jgi:SAM-dependent methyltransferase